jgi:hypothetical protein
LTPELFASAAGDRSCACNTPVAEANRPHSTTVLEGAIAAVLNYRKTHTGSAILLVCSGSYSPAVQPQQPDRSHHHVEFNCAGSNWARSNRLR